MRKIMLVILDGWGHSVEQKGNAIFKADTPYMDRFYKEYPHSLLHASGEAVGLPPGQMGNSEVGHLNLGAGRVVYQELTRITRCIEQGDFFDNKVLVKAMQEADREGGSLHLVGLLSDGGVHSHIDHLLALLEMAAQQKVGKVYIHAILDGRDTLPYGAGTFLKKVVECGEKNACGQIATISGRYYAMDRDQRWERTARAYRALTKGEGINATDPLKALKEAYDSGESDEFVKPIVLTDSNGQPLSTIKTEDSVIFFNFRPDRARQLSRAFVDEDFDHFDRGSNPPRPYFATMTRYDRTMDVPAAFTFDDLENTLGEVYANAGLPQVRIAETEKYAHVTFFFSGGREKPFPKEDRILVPSPQVATYDLKPEMSAPEVAREVVRVAKEGHHALAVVNFANPDMVSHSGKLSAAVQAVETVDRCLGEIAAEAIPRGWHILVCSDHGNAEQMLDSEGATLTAHSSNPVPLLILGGQEQKLRDQGKLADVAPTILKLAGLDVPEEMTGESMVL